MATVAQQCEWVYRKATISQHCALMGELTREIRAYHIGEVREYDMSRRLSVTVSFIRPRRRKAFYYTITADDLRYLTITADGSLLYDSRADVPCDMDTWAATNAKHQGNRPLTMRRTPWTEEERKASAQQTADARMKKGATLPITAPPITGED